MPRLHQRNLLRATSIKLRNLLRWCKRGIKPHIRRWNNAPIRETFAALNYTSGFGGRHLGIVIEMSVQGWICS